MPGPCWSAPTSPPPAVPRRPSSAGAELACRAIQIFNQNPRAWKPTTYSKDQVEAFHEAMKDSRVDALLIHAVYLLNPASEDREIRDKTLASLTASLQAGDALGAVAVVLHPGSAKEGDVGEAIARAGEVINEALAESEHVRAAPREHRRRGRHARALVRRAGRR